MALTCLSAFTLMQQPRVLSSTVEALTAVGPAQWLSGLRHPIYPSRHVTPSDERSASSSVQVEDFIHSPPFSTYQAWLAERGETWDGPLVPLFGVRSHPTDVARIGDGCQVGAMTHHAALYPHCCHSTWSQMNTSVWHYNEPNNHCPMRTFPSQTWTCSSWHQATVKMANHCDLGDDKAQTSMVGGDPPPRGASRNLPSNK